MARSRSAAAIEDLRALVRPFGGDVFCHAPVGVPFDLAALDRPDDPCDRWGAPGTRTAYLAADPFVAVAEYARHGDPTCRRDGRRLMRLTLSPLPAIDVRDAAVRSLLGLDSPESFADGRTARAAATAIRDTRVCAALLVPSVAFVDQLERHNVLVFCEAVDGGLGAVLSNPTEIGLVTIDR
ncbi:MAG TPA: RES domain-containing protein [Candidatus Limnocylindrales bacterium]|nr:RES domain-containing protein [Candidatus Limnocylindrales bacterium]